MIRTGKFILTASALLLIMTGCVDKNLYLQKQAEANAYRQDVDLLTIKTRQLQSTLESMERENLDLSAQKEKMKAECEKIVAEKRDIETASTKYLKEATSRIEQLRDQNAELAGDKQMLNESIALLKRNKETEVKKVSGTYENLLQKMEKEIQQGQIAITELKGKLTVDVVDKILFDSGKAEIKPAGLEILNRVVDILATAEEKSIRVEGHTDNVPIKGNLTKQFPTNWELSAARALTVVRYLENQGITPGLLAAVAFGQHQPVADNETPEGRARNRRIAIVLQTND
jgi:chemotaxis protein MotB